MSADVLRQLLQHLPPPRTAAEAAAREAQAGVGAPAPAPREEENLRKCSFDLPSELAHQFRVLCAVQGVKQRRVVEGLIAAWVREQGAALPRSA